MAKKLQRENLSPEKSDIEKFGKGIYFDQNFHHYFYDGDSKILLGEDGSQLSIKHDLVNQLFYSPKNVVEKNLETMDREIKRQQKQRDWLKEKLALI